MFENTGYGYGEGPHVTNMMGGSISLPLLCAMLVYGDADRREAGLVTCHALSRKAGEAPRLEPGVCLDIRALDKLLQGMEGKIRHREIFPETLLFFDGSLMLWHAPSRRASIFFSTQQEVNRELCEQVSAKVVFHPPLLFAAFGQNFGTRLRVWALDSDARPRAGSKLYRAPYFNMYEDGGMCVGNVTLPEFPVPAEIPAWEKAFYNTNFTHANGGGGMTRPLCAHPEGHLGFWKEMVRLGDSGAGSGEEVMKTVSPWLVPDKISTLQQLLAAGVSARKDL